MQRICCTTEKTLLGTYWTFFGNLWKKHVSAFTICEMGKRLFIVIICEWGSVAKQQKEEALLEMCKQFFLKFINLFMVLPCVNQLLIIWFTFMSRISTDLTSLLDYHCLITVTVLGKCFNLLKAKACMVKWRSHLAHYNFSLNVSKCLQHHGQPTLQQVQAS